MDEITPFIKEVDRLMTDNGNVNNEIVENANDMANSQDVPMECDQSSNKRVLEDSEEVQRPIRKFRFTGQKDVNVENLAQSDTHRNSGQSPGSQDGSLHISQADSNHSTPTVLLIKPTSDNAKDLINNPLEIISVIKNTNLAS